MSVPNLDSLHRKTNPRAESPYGGPQLSRQKGIDQFRYIKIQPKTIDFNTRLLGINSTNSVVIPMSLAEYWSIAHGKRKLRYLGHVYGQKKNAGGLGRVSLLLHHLKTPDLSSLSPFSSINFFTFKGFS